VCSRSIRHNCWTVVRTSTYHRAADEYALSLRLRSLPTIVTIFYLRTQFKLIKHIKININWTQFEHLKIAWTQFDVILLFIPLDIQRYRNVVLSGHVLITLKTVVWKINTTCRRTRASRPRVIFISARDSRLVFILGMCYFIRLARNLKQRINST